MGAYRNTSTMKGGFFLAYVPVPKDLSKVKTKVAFNLTKRQIVCFAAALILGLPLFFLLKDSTGTMPCVNGDDCRHAALFPACHV